jgi:hypothetical protein
LDALLDDSWIAYAVFVEERCQARLACPLGVPERGPAGEEVAEHQRAFLIEPVQDLGKVLLER